LGGHKTRTLHRYIRVLICFYDAYAYTYTYMNKNENSTYVSLFKDNYFICTEKFYKLIVFLLNIFISKIPQESPEIKRQKLTWRTNSSCGDNIIFLLIRFTLMLSLCIVHFLPTPKHSLFTNCLQKYLANDNVLFCIL
jgi:hypothetical protein